MMLSAFLTVDEFAAEYGVSVSTVKRMLKRGDLMKSQVKKRHAIRIPRAELERLKTGTQSDGCVPVCRGVDAEHRTQVELEQTLPGPKPKWLR